MIDRDTVSPFITPDVYRAHILPDMSRHYLLLENMIYGLAEQHCALYRGGYWEMIRAPHEGQVARFIYPDSIGDAVLVVNPDNYFEGVLNAVEFGIGLTLIALSRIAITKDDQHAVLSHERLTDWMYQNNPSERLLAYLD